MAIFKGQWFFTQGNAGWSETHYVTQETSANAMIRAVNMIPPRVALLGGPGANAPTLRQIRVSNIAIQRDSFVWVVAPADGIAPNPISVADIVHTCLVIRLNSTDLYRRSLMLRGIPDVVISNNGVFNFDPGYMARLDAYEVALIAQGFGMLAAAKPLGMPLIANVTASGITNAGVLITTVAPHGLVTGDTVRIVSTPGISQTGGATIRGRWQVAAQPDPLQFAVVGTLPPTGTYLGGGRYYKITMEVRLYTSGEVVRASHRITGRPFDVPVGAHRR